MSAQFPEPTRHLIGDLTAAQLRTVCALYDRIWPPAEGPSADRAEKLRADWTREDREIFVVWAGETPLATAMFFPRDILTASGALRVMALAGVCSAPEFRGRRLGVEVVRAAFAQVDRGVFGAALFQTGVPGFYEKLGARLVGNLFVNSRYRPGDRGSAAQPWWDPHAMVYPARYAWPEGTIDLLGAGY